MNFSFRARYPVSTAVNSNTWRRCDVICPVFSVFFSFLFFYSRDSRRKRCEKTEGRCASAVMSVPRTRWTGSWWDVRMICEIRFITILDRSWWYEAKEKLKRKRGKRISCDRVKVSRRKFWPITSLDCLRWPPWASPRSSYWTSTSRSCRSSGRPRRNCKVRHWLSLLIVLFALSAPSLVFMDDLNAAGTKQQ